MPEQQGYLNQTLANYPHARSIKLNQFIVKHGF